MGIPLKIVSVRIDDRWMISPPSYAEPGRIG